MKRLNFYFIGIFLLIISFFLDTAVSNFFINNRVGFLDSISVFIHNIAFYVFFAFALIIFLVFKEKKNVLPLIISFFLYMGIIQSLKIAIGRPRPFTSFGFSDLGESSVNRSFPSGHASAASSLIRFFEFNRILFWAWIVIAIFVAFSRVYLGMHYLSDVVAGFVLGYAISDFSIFITKNLKTKKGEKKHGRRIKKKN